MRFEVMRLDDVDGTPVDTTVVDAASVNRIVQQAAAIGQRLWIRPADTSALRSPRTPSTHARPPGPARALACGALFVALARPGSPG